MSDSRITFRLCLLILCLEVLTSAFPAASTAIKLNPGESIQAAIDEAKNGDVIYVSSGIYKESINLTKQITLIGIDQPEIDALGGENGVTLSANKTSFDGFRITNSAINGIYVLSNQNHIANNTISDAANAIFLENSNGNMIRLNKAHGSGLIGNGICLNFSSDNVLADNSAACGWIGFGIFLDKSGNNTISGNNAKSGWLMGAGISLANDSSYNRITKNQAVCGWNGNGIALTNSMHNRIEGNNARTTCWGWRDTWTIYWGNGIMLQDSDNNLIRNNGASNGYIGIFFVSSNGNELIKNNASGNLNGIGLITAKRNIISGNIIENNSDRGLGFLDSSQGNVLMGNIIKNNKYGIYFQDSSLNIIYANNSYQENSIKTDSLRCMNSWRK